MLLIGFRNDITDSLKLAHFIPKEMQTNYKNLNIRNLGNFHLLWLNQYRLDPY